MEIALPSIPAKRYFTIGEVSELCGVKPYVLRYWEQEFAQLKPMKRRGNRRYYQHHEVLLIRRIRDLLYDQGFTISGARNRLADAAPGARTPLADGAEEDIQPAAPDDEMQAARSEAVCAVEAVVARVTVPLLEFGRLRAELLAIRELLSAAEPVPAIIKLPVGV